MSVVADQYAYEAQTADGRVLKGTLEAASAEDAQSRLAALQLHVLSVTTAAIEGEKAPRRRGALGVDDFMIFNQQLAHLTESGMPVERGLRLIALDLKSGKLARAAEQVASELEKGKPMKEAFSAHASQFPPLYGKLVEAGASAGNLPGMLFNLGKHMELTARLRQSLWRTLSYPLMVLAALSLVLLLISIYVLPSFRAMYADFKIAPVLITEALLVLGQVYPYVFTVVVGAIVLAILANVGIRAGGGQGMRVESVLGSVPLISGIIRSSILARWVDALRLGVEAGLDLPRAIDLATEATAGAGGALQRDAKKLHDLLVQGAPLSTYQGSYIPPTVPAAIELAASSSDLPTALHGLTRMYEQQADQRLRLLPSVLTPLLMVIVGGSIGLCIGALFSPLVQFIRSISSGDMW